ncbi:MULTISPECIES: carboxypeptidase regulatory-like domain-containing protein [Actinoplanes]|uniref:carboxypeptidase regulatory-like domain-containing protein n=1 Tax=Actinoplanes TaxID=1865 RepID=UPI0014703DE7|nr:MULTISPECIES: carboxypeptidase regulatory-like domain-containing protein [Actinoplanes]
MTTHLRARTTQAGAFLALVTGLVAGVQTAALAAPPNVSIGSVSATEVATGGTVTIQYTISNPGGGDGGEGGEGSAAAAAVGIEVSGPNCSGDCSSVKTFTGDQSFTANFTAPNVSAGETKTFTVKITAKTTEGTNSTSQTITVKGEDKPETVRQVSGRVKDGDGKQISGVSIAMSDSGGHSYDTVTNSEGRYSFTSSDSRPITPGTVQIGALKDGYESTSASANAGAGKTVNVAITLKKLAAATTSPTPSPSASVSAEPTEDEEALEDEPTEGETSAAGDIDAENKSGEDEGGSNWLLIIMGVLLVAAGIGAMVLVWMRRKNAEAEGDDDKLAGAGAGGAGFDATRVASPAGVGGRGNDATMIAPAAGMGGGSLGDAPTMIHRPAAPVEDEFPDPYGVPMPPQGSFAGNTSTYGAQQGGYGQQDAYGGYNDGGQQQGQAPGQRYDERTGMYQPEQGQGGQQGQRYDEHTSMYQPGQDDGYGQQQGGYDQQGGWGAQDDGYGNQQQGGWGGQQQGGYDQQDGWGNQQQGGYDQQGGWGAQDDGYGNQQPQQGGWGGGQNDGYGNQQPQRGGGTYGAAPHNGPPGQRRNEWDD